MPPPEGEETEPPEPYPRDIFKGNLVSIWEDEELVYFNFPHVTVSFPKEIWEQILGELAELLESLRGNGQSISMQPYAR